MELTINLKKPHPKQEAFIRSRAKRKIIRAGRRGGKTVGASILAVEQFLKGRRILYATPTQEQVDSFWWNVKQALNEPIEAGIFYKNETRHIIELQKTEQRIRAKTAWNADTLRGDFADVLILDEYQMMSADTWELVGAPMLADNNGDAIFIFTSKRGKHHSKELFKRAQQDRRWETFVFSSFDNPYISRSALDELTQDMTRLAYRAEILAEDIEDDPDALWSREIIDHVISHPDLQQLVVGVDPPGSSTGAECGIIVAGTAKIKDQLHGFVIEDRSLQGTPARWGQEAVTAYLHNGANWLAGESNYGGEMVEHTIKSVARGQRVAYKDVRASRGKHIRAEPVVAYYEQGLIHHVGEFSQLEDEMCNWVPDSGMPSPNRIDALVWAFTLLMVGKINKAKVVMVEW